MSSGQQVVAPRYRSVSVKEYVDLKEKHKEKALSLLRLWVEEEEEDDDDDVKGGGGGGDLKKQKKKSIKSHEINIFLFFLGDATVGLELKKRKEGG